MEMEHEESTNKEEISQLGRIRESRSVNGKQKGGEEAERSQQK